ncbi:MAG TPA: hypothetical protein PLO51_06035 [Candidatus Micrarchaeota archaeon]|nr:hypothetical protein [Candidatus Micrarchaeota archaeon]
MARNPIVAIIMMVIPIVDIYLIYKWWSELKQAKKSDADPIIYTILMLIPVIDLYALYKLMTDVESAGKKAGKGGYALGVIPLMIVSIILMGIPLIYVVYRTQEIMNQCGI